MAETDVLDLVAGAGELAKRCAVTIAGGDVVGAPALTVCVTAVGWSSATHRARDALRREGRAISSASPGGWAVRPRRSPCSTPGSTPTSDSSRAFAARNRGSPQARLPPRPGRTP